jgi:DNA-binding NarL/FixJ family response regulator
VRSVWAKPQKLGRDRTVLVVDDNPGIRQAVAKAFLSDGFAICGEASNGREAVDLARKLKPNLIILDLAMPVMNGLEAAPVLREVVPGTPIILFTLYGREVQQDQVSELGIDLVLSKTESLDMVLQKAHELMGDESSPPQ